MKIYFFSFLFILANIFASLSQNSFPKATKAEVRKNAFEQRKLLNKKSLVANIPFDNIGPTIMSGRVCDVDVNPEDQTHFIVAYASGGLWKTTNNGTTFTPIFDQEAVMSIGDVAVDWENNTIWVGTGEVNSSRSSYAGLGIFKSTDGGKTWTHQGLEDSQHIGRIVLHPEDQNTLWVAVLGHLYSDNMERGVYKTSDGGRHWSKTLFIDDKTGAVDLVMDPNNANTLYASTWQRSRSAWNFTEAGIGSGIYKSTDGGNHWNKINLESNGFPTGEGVGRIGLSASSADGKTTIYALLDNYFRRPKEDEDEGGDLLVKEDFKEMSKDELLAIKSDKIESYLRENRFPQKYTAKMVIGMIKQDKIKPSDLAYYLENANSLLFDTPVIGAELYRSDDGGKSWTKTHNDYLDGVYNSYGYYFGTIATDPTDPDKVYIAGVPILKSADGGKTFKSINGANVHVDHHSIWVNPNRHGHIINGNDGGLNISYDDGENWIKCNSPSIGQFYYVNVDMAEPYNVYGGLQDNGVWTGPSNYQSSARWHSSGQYPYQSLLGGDGMQVQIDTRDNNTIYAGTQFGNYSRISRSGGPRSRITPRHELGEQPYRWNWQAPIHLSIHNQDIVYFGAEKLFRSFNQGADFHAISEDLTKGGKKGDVPYGTLTTIHESPLKFGLIYTGSDDGLIYKTTDGGNRWELISKHLPQDLWVSRVQASGHEEAVVYATLNGYRWDDFNAYVYKSSDFGQNWEKIGIDLPNEPINVIKEDPKNPDILYVGTDHGCFVSIDGGSNFMKFSEGLPAVPVHDLVIHPREGDLILGTHGRSIYKADITPLRKLHEIQSNEIYVYNLSDINYNANAGRQFAPYRDPIEPELDITVFTPSEGTATLEVQTSDGNNLYKKELNMKKGISIVEYDLSIDNDAKNVLLEYLKGKAKGDKAKEIEVNEADNGKIYLQVGEYKILVTKNEQSSEQNLKITEPRGRRF